MTATPNTAALQALLMKVEAGTFLMDILPGKHERLAYDAFSGSLDAAKSLHEAVTPYPDVDIQYRLFGGLCDVTIYDVDGGQVQGTSIHGIARAWMIAILRALIAAPVTENEGGV